MRSNVNVGKSRLPFAGTLTNSASGTAITLKDYAGNTITVGSADQVLITGMCVGDAAGAGGTFQIQTSASVPLLVVVGPTVGGGGIISVHDNSHIILPAGVTLKVVGTANCYCNVWGFVLR